MSNIHIELAWLTGEVFQPVRSPLCQTAIPLWPSWGQTCCPCLLKTHHTSRSSMSTKAVLSATCCWVGRSRMTVRQTDLPQIVYQNGIKNILSWSPYMSNGFVRSQNILSRRKNRRWSKRNLNAIVVKSRRLNWCRQPRGLRRCLKVLQLPLGHSFGNSNGLMSASLRDACTILKNYPIFTLAHYNYGAEHLSTNIRIRCCWNHIWLLMRFSHAVKMLDVIQAFLS